MKYRRRLVFGLFFLFSLLLSCSHSKTPKLTSSAPDPWPRDFTGPKGGHLTVYQPQFEKWDNYKTIEARVAAGLTPAGQKNPMLGTFKLTGLTQVDTNTRKVLISNLKLSEINFPTLDPSLLPTLSQAVEENLPKNGITVSMDRILGSLERSKEINRAVAVKNNPPPIFFSDKPALLVIIDGPPVWSPILLTNLKYAVNTNWDLFQDGSGTLYLRNGDKWLKSSNLNGPWGPAGALPSSFSNLPTDTENWKDVLASLPGKEMSPDQVPTVFVSQVPAEMIVISGPPVLEAIPGTNISWVKNSDSDLFVENNNYYFLTSGRWFSSPGGAQGPWTYASDSLPDDFRRIPSDNPKANVLASVPGTRAAEEALIQAAIPVKATIKRSEAKASVSYSGDPKFENIQGTSLQYAVNTSNQILHYKDKYFLVKNGVWFVSSSAQGPWMVADSVPQEIYTIPPSSPLYNVTYVQVYDSDPDSVTVGYTSGYLGAFVVGTALGATLTYGTGWYYPPAVYGGFYHPYPYTYGMAAYYNPWTGTYGRYGQYYGPYGGAGYGAVYNPATGTFARGAAAYGPYGGYRGYAQAYNPWTNTYAATRQGSNGYDNWGSSVVQRNDNWAQTGHVGNGTDGVAGYNTSAGNKGFVAHDGNDVYAGRDGNVYKNTGDGWQKYDNGSWNNVGGQKQTGSPSGLQSDQKNQGSPQDKADQKAPSQNTAHDENLGQKGDEARQNRNPSASNLDSDTERQLNHDNMNRDRANQRDFNSQSFQRGSDGGEGFASRQGSGSQFGGDRNFGGGRDFNWGGGQRDGGGFDRGGGGGFERGGGGGFGGFGGGGGRRR